MTTRDYKTVEWAAFARQGQRLIAARKSSRTVYAAVVVHWGATVFVCAHPHRSGATANACASETMHGMIRAAREREVPRLGCTCLGSQGGPDYCEVHAS